MRTNYPPKPCELHRLKRPVDIHFIAVIACHTHFVRMAHATLAYRYSHDSCMTVLRHSSRHDKLDVFLLNARLNSGGG